MRILLFSDSHGYTHNMVRAVGKNKNIEMILHLGDGVKDVNRLRESYGNMRYEYVRGNNDWIGDCPSEKMLELEGKKIFITHGHHYGVKTDYQRIVNRGKAVGADAVFFGHTHQAEEFFSDGMLLLNPGSISLPVYPAGPTYCLVEIKENKILPRFLGFK